MCRAKWEGGRRCDGRHGGWHVNREGHLRWEPDEEQERHFKKPEHLLSMTRGALAVRRHRARKYAAEVNAMRTIHGVAPDAPIGPVLREQLWAQRYQGAGLSLVALAETFKAVAADEDKTVDEIAARHQSETVIPHRQRAGERLADLVMERPDWVNPDHLVASIEPPDNGTPNPAYMRLVKDADGAEWLLVTSYDGSEPQAWKNDDAGMKAAAWECLERVRAVDADEEANAAYHRWLDENDANQSDSYGPWTQHMSEHDFLDNFEDEGLHLV